MYIYTQICVCAWVCVCVRAQVGVYCLYVLVPSYSHTHTWTYDSQHQILEHRACSNHWASRPRGGFHIFSNYSKELCFVMFFFQFPVGPEGPCCFAVPIHIHSCHSPTTALPPGHPLPRPLQSRVGMARC